MFRNKEYIYSVYKEQSFTKAAEKLHISAPALSAMIKRIETQLGMPVFDRKTSPISLTAFGVEYIKSIEAVNELEERLQGITYKLQTVQTGHLSLCASNISADYCVAETIAAFVTKYPNISLNVISVNTISSKQMLDSREADLIITTRPLDNREYEKFPIFKEMMILIVPQKMEINEKFKELALTKKTIKDIFSPSVAGVSLSDFRELPFILSNNRNYLRSCTDMLFREAHFNPTVALEVEEAMITLNFVRYGIGATIVNHQLVERTDFEDHFCLYKLNSDYSQRTGYVCYRAGTYVTPAMEKFLELITASYAASRGNKKTGSGAVPV